MYHDLICDLKKIQVSVSYLKLLLKEYGQANNRYFLGRPILPNYVDTVPPLI